MPTTRTTDQLERAAVHPRQPFLDDPSVCPMHRHSSLIHGGGGKKCGGKRWLGLARLARSGVAITRHPPDEGGIGMAGRCHAARGDDAIYPWQCHGRILREIESTNGEQQRSGEHQEQQKNQVAS
uniref:Uncharacterized protein n=1 Tax=Oryza nivara TaxID=4536 RepID=A0A0E0I7M0_ORYNI